MKYDPHFPVPGQLLFCKFFKNFIVPVLLVMLFSVQACAAAAPDTWTGGDGSWTAPRNWSNNAVPTSSTATVIDSGTANLTETNSGTYSTLVLGGTGTATLSISGGSLTSGSSTVLGQSAGSQGTANITSGTWKTNSFVIGQSGTGVLNMSGSSFVDATGNGGMILAKEEGSVGILNFSGGTLKTGLVAAGLGTAIINFTTVTSSTFTPSIGNGRFSVNQTGIGTTVLTGNNVYVGSTSVLAGTLTVNGKITNSTITVTGGTLNGSGTTANVIVGNGGVLAGSLSSKAVTVTAGGTVSPGNSPGANSATSLSLSGSATFKAEIVVPGGGNWTGTHPIAGTDYDQMTLSGSSDGIAETVLTLDSTAGSGSILRLNVTGSLPAAGVASGANSYDPLGPNSTLDNYFILTLSDSADTISGRFARVTLDGITFADIDYSSSNIFGGLNGVGTFTLNGQTWAISYTGDSSTNSTIGGNDVVLTAVPEPTSCALLGTGLLDLLILRVCISRRGFVAPA